MFGHFVEIASLIIGHFGFNAKKQFYNDMGKFQSVVSAACTVAFDIQIGTTIWSLSLKA